MANGIAVVTIAARNYFALARSLLASVAEVEPAADRFVFVTDDLAAVEACAEGRVLSPAALYGAEAYAKLARAYDVTELATAVKPAVLRYLLGRGYDRVLFFDPDIQVFAALDPLVAALDEHDIASTASSRRNSASCGMERTTWASSAWRIGRLLSPCSIGGRSASSAFALPTCTPVCSSTRNGWISFRRCSHARRSCDTAAATSRIGTFTRGRSRSASGRGSFPASR